MCGIAGFYGPPDGALLHAMTARIVHRGPDAEGFHEHRAASLGHRRLSIIDLEGGTQPMANEAGSVQLAYNGEIYNYRELRAELADLGQQFSTASDTEVLLRAYEQWGTGCFARCNGMWAAAILDVRDGGAPRLVLSRDHLGIKPLYTAVVDGRLLFASEPKALLAAPGLVATPDRRRLAEYLLAGLHDHDERTFFAGISQVPPASTIVVDANGSTIERYWTPRLSSGGDPDPRAFRAAFKRAVERRLVADVPVGTCLSGGLDSSAIVTTMTELLAESAPDAISLGGRLQTFSAVFDGDPIDEQRYIAPVLAATGAAGHEVRPRASDLIGDLPLVVWHQDEPMVSSGPYAQYRVMALAEGHVKVLLDGQGGDELLGGYVPYQYVYLRELLRRRRFGLLIREAVAGADVLWPLVKSRLADRRRRVVRARLCAPGLAALAGGGGRVTADVRVQDDLKKRLLQDLTTYSLPSLLRYEDRNSMAHSMESRPPMLDQELVEHVLALPTDAFVRGGWSRWVLREALADVLPEAIRRRRKKIGFTTPEIRWLRAERAAVQGILRSPATASRGLVDAPGVARAFAACCDGSLEESPFFWRVLNAEAWMRVFCGSAPLSPAGARPHASLQRAGDEESAALVGPGAAKLLADCTPNPGRHLFMVGPEGREAHARIPCRTPVISAGDDLFAVISRALEAAPALVGGDVVAVSEKAVAVSQGRSFPASSVKTGPLARVLSRFVHRSAAGIGLGIPATMQLAINEVGAPRIVLAAGASALARPFGVRGLFYQVAGREVAAIDGPTAGTLPPFDTHAKLPPADPDGVAATLSARLSEEASVPVGVAVVDANDRGVVILGATAGVDRQVVAWLFGDNPLGQGTEQTPVALLRRVGTLPSSPAA